MASLQNGLPERDPRRGRDPYQRGAGPNGGAGGYPSGPRRQPAAPAGYAPRGGGGGGGGGSSGGGGGGYSNGSSRGYGGTEYENSQTRQQYPQDRSKSRRRGEPMYQDMNGSVEGQQRLAGLADVLATIRRDWDFMTRDDCIPVQIALQLNDPSSLGKANRLRDFRVIKKNLEEALQAVVNEYHQGFNSSIGTYHAIMRHIGTSAAKVQDLKQRVVSAKKDLTSERTEVKNLLVDSQVYESMLQTLSQIEHLRDVPERLDLRMGEKRFLTAVDILMEGLKNSERQELKGIGALHDLRRGLQDQESSLAEILIEELHSHLYLKSPYCDGRWNSYSAQKENKTSDQLLGGEVIPQAAVTKRALDTFLETEDLTKEMVEDASKNIEAESLHYIRLLIESLHKLGRLPAALEQISQRLPVELNKVVEKTNLEVDGRHPSSFGLSKALKDGKAIDSVLSDKNERVEVLNDLLYTLFSKFEAILEGHRVVHDVVKAIGKRDWNKEGGGATTLSGGFMEIWKLLQSETRSLLHDYITANDNRIMSSNAPKAVQNSVNAILGANSAMQKKRRLFKFAGPEGTDPMTKSSQDDLEAILKANVPGLVQDSAVPTIRETEETQISDGSATGRKLLVESTVFNMGHLLSPSLQFLNHVKDIVPPGLGVAPSTFTSFLDDFLVNVFLPQLEDTLRELTAQTTGELDAFQQDPQWKHVAQRPVMKGTAGFLSLITAICRMLDNLPHDQAFSQLIVDLLTDYYEKCHAFFRSLVEKAPGVLKKSAAWVQPGELEQTMRQMWADPSVFHDFLYKETLVFARLKGKEGVAIEDIISDRKTIYNLCVLYNSMDWFSRKLKKLRQITDVEDPSRDEGTRNRRWNNINSKLSRDTAAPVFLPLNKDLAEAFDGVVYTFGELANTVILTLRAEARSHAAHYIDMAVTRTSWLLENEALEADPQILTLNSELVWFDQDVTALLRYEEQRFIKAGLGVYFDHLLIRSCGMIKEMNRKGVDKMLLDILVLQQNLRNLVLEDGVVGDGRGREDREVVTLRRSDEYWRLFTTGPEEVLQKAKDGTLSYTYDELKDLVTLWYTDNFKVGGNRRESTLAARRSLNDHLIQLSELMWDK